MQEHLTENLFPLAEMKYSIKNPFPPAGKIASIFRNWKKLEKKGYTT